MAKANPTATNVSSVTFTMWTGQRQITSLGSTAGYNPLAFERWRDFKEAFAPELTQSQGFLDTQADRVAATLLGQCRISD